MASPQWDLFSGEVASSMSKLWHRAELSLREYGSVVTNEVWSDYAGGTYSYSTLEDSLEAYLDVAVGGHCQIVDLFHHWLGSACVDGVELFLLQNFLCYFWDLVLFAVGSVICCE